VLNTATSLSTREVLLYMGIPLVVVLLAAAFWPAKRHDEEPVDEALLASLEQHGDRGGDVVQPRLGAYPVPPMDLRVPIAPVRTARAVPVMSGPLSTSAPGATATNEGASSVVS